MPSPTPTPTTTQADVVVTARRSPTDNTFLYSQLLRRSLDSGGGAAGGSAAPSGGGSGDGSGRTGTEMVGVVNVQVDDPANLDAAIEAAQVVPAALLKILEETASSADSEVVVIGNFRSTVGNLRFLATNTEWVVTDKSYEKINGGVGASFRASDGKTTDYLNFRDFRPGPTGYAANTYTNMQGLVGILLHEIGHLSSIGSSFGNASFGSYVRNNNGSPDGYIGSQHYLNNEKFSKDFMKAFATKTGLDISNFNPTYGYGHVPPSTIRSR